MQFKKHLTIVFLFVLSLVIYSNNAFANSPSADRQTVFNDLTDYLATMGKDDQMKKEIVSDRQKLRRQERLMNESHKKKQIMKSKMKAQEELIMRKVKSLQN